MVRGIGCALILLSLMAATGVAADSATVESLKTWLAEPPDKRGDIASKPFAGEPLTKDEAKAVAELLWKDHAARIKESRAAEMKHRVIEIDGKKMPFWYKVFGDRPEGGRSLFFSLHGGGGAPKAVNDSQWENQKRLYKPKEGVYLCPRGATDTWNLWHEAHIDKMFARLIENLIVFEDVDPNRVYVMGYSAGGDGVYQLAPRMADRWAAAAMMAGHPNDASPLGLRNVPFALHVGARDGAYDRNKVAKKWGDELAELRKKDEGGYEHQVEIHEGKGHWMDLQDAKAVPWMAEKTRNPLPQKIIWRQDDVRHPRFYWLAVDPEKSAKRATITATRDKQTITLESKEGGEVAVLLNDEIVDLDQDVTITAAGKQLHSGKATRTIATVARTLAEYGDPKLMFSAEIKVKLSE